MITVLLVLALARTRRGQRAIRATREALAWTWWALQPIFVELAALGRSIIHKIRTLFRRRRT